MSGDARNEAVPAEPDGTGAYHTALSDGAEGPVVEAMPDHGEDADLRSRIGAKVAAADSGGVADATVTAAAAFASVTSEDHAGDASDSGGSEHHHRHEHDGDDASDDGTDAAADPSVPDTHPDPPAPAEPDTDGQHSDT
jgi:hypothetical protein